MVKIAFSAGHYLGTSGKQIPSYMGSFDLKKEWELNERITRYTENILADYKDVEILRVDDVTGKTNTTLNQRTNKANKWKADMYVSNHHNAGIGGGDGGGTVVYTYPNSSLFTKTMAKNLYNSLIDETGLKGNRYYPITSANFHELRETNMPAVLIEHGYMDSKTDLPIILTDKFAKESAQGLANFLIEHFKLEKKEEPIKVTDELFRVQAGAFSVKTNAIRMMDQIKKKDYDVILVETGGLYKVQVGAFSNKSNAIKLGNKLAKDGFRNFITTEQGNVVSVTEDKDPVEKEKESENKVDHIEESARFVDGKVKELQEKLIKVGYELPKYGADGIYGEETHYALLKFQKDNNLTVDGYAGKKTFAKLDELIKKDTSDNLIKELQKALNKHYNARLIVDGIYGRNTRSALNKVVLKKLDKNDLVKVSQKRLNQLGFNAGAEDGIFGIKTKKAVMRLQRNKGILVDGIIGTQTWSKLFK